MTDFSSYAQHRHTVVNDSGTLKPEPNPQDADKQHRAAAAELQAHNSRLTGVEQGITQVMGEMERLGAKRTYLRCMGMEMVGMRPGNKLDYIWGC